MRDDLEPELSLMAAVISDAIMVVLKRAWGVMESGEKKNYPKVPKWIPAVGQWMILEAAPDAEPKHPAFLCTRIEHDSLHHHKFFYFMHNDKEAHYYCLPEKMRKATQREITGGTPKAPDCPERKEWEAKAGDKVHYCIDKGGTCHLEIIGIIEEVTVPGSRPRRVRFQGVKDSYSMEYCTLLKAAPKG